MASSGLGRRPFTVVCRLSSLGLGLLGLGLLGLGLLGGEFDHVI